MDEKEEKQETQTNSDEGVQSKTTTELDRADQIAERMARENRAREKILDREENLEARRKVGGMSEAGQSQEKPKEETAQEYKDRVMSGNL